MPIYEYECGSCEYRFEVKQGFNDAPLTACGRCGGAVTKLISAPAIMFKGEGWYVTDYSDKLKPPTQAGSGEKPAEGKKEEKDKQEKKESTAAPAAAGASAAPSSSGESSSASGSSSGSSTGGSSSGSDGNSGANS